MIAIRRMVLLTPALLALATCAPSARAPAMLDLTAIGAAGQNPDPSGAGAPLAISVFYLNRTDSFDRADFFALTERDKQTLGADEAGSEIFVLVPGETHTLGRALKPGVRAVGIAAQFRDIDRATWRVSAPVSDSGPTRLTLTVGKRSVSLTPSP